MKTIRQKRILELIAATPVETQEELTALLISEGFRVTQATVSRDIKELRIVKVTDSEGRDRYAASPADAPVEKAKYNDLIVRTVISAKSARNLAVVKTYSGMAQAAGAAIDAIGFEGVLGCIGGDDTLLLVTETDDEAALIAQLLGEMIA